MIFTWFTSSTRLHPPTYLLFYFIIKIECLQNHGSFLACFILPQGSQQGDTWNSTALFGTLTISSQKEINNSPMAHKEQHLSTLIGGCLEVLTLYLVKQYQGFYSVNPLRITSLLKYSLYTFYIIFEISSFSARQITVSCS